MTRTATIAAVEEASARDDHDAVLALTDAILAERPGDDAAHELRARSLLALGRIEEAERHASDAVRLDPDEIRYRELLAQVLAAGGAHREAADEYGRLRRNDPRQPSWITAEAEERLGGEDADRAADAARSAIRLDPSNAEAQLTLARSLVRSGDASGALRAAQTATQLRPGDPIAREVLADARWLADQDAAAFAEFRALSLELSGPARDRVTEKARALYRQRAGAFGRMLATVPALFHALLRRGWINVT